MEGKKSSNKDEGTNVPMMMAYRFHPPTKQQQLSGAESSSSLLELRFERLPIPGLVQPPAHKPHLDWNLGEEELLVRVEALGVCHRDLLERRGGFYSTMILPITPGHEFSGVVVAAGPGAKFTRGSRVVNLHSGRCGHCQNCNQTQAEISSRRLGPRWCLNSGPFYGNTTNGAYANFVLCQSASLVELPRSLSFIESCFLMCTATVAYRALKSHAQLQPNERVLITGASGGVGIHAIQIAKALGAHVIALTTSSDKVEVLKKFGADEVLVCEGGITAANFYKDINRVGGVVDVCLECVGVPTMNASLRSLRPGGRLVVVGNVTLGREHLNPGLIILKELQITGSSSVTREEMEDVLNLVLTGKLKPVVHRVMKLEDLEEAHRLLVDKSVVGRIVLIPSKPPKNSVDYLPQLYEDAPQNANL